MTLFLFVFVVEYLRNLMKGVTAMDAKVVEAVESLTEEQLTLFLAFLQGISDSQTELPCSDRTGKQRA